MAECGQSTSTVTTCVNGDCETVTLIEQTECNAVEEWLVSSSDDDTGVYIFLGVVGFILLSLILWGVISTIVYREKPEEQQDEYKIDESQFDYNEEDYKL